MRAGAVGKAGVGTRKALQKQWKDKCMNCGEQSISPHLTFSTVCVSMCITDEEQIDEVYN